MAVEKINLIKKNLHFFKLENNGKYMAFQADSETLFPKDNYIQVALHDLYFERYIKVAEKSPFCGLSLLFELIMCFKQKKGAFIDNYTNHFKKIVNLDWIDQAEEKNEFHEYYGLKQYMLKNGFVNTTELLEGVKKQNQKAKEVFRDMTKKWIKPQLDILKECELIDYEIVVTGNKNGETSNQIKITKIRCIPSQIDYTGRKWGFVIVPNTFMFSTKHRIKSIDVLYYIAYMKAIYEKKIHLDKDKALHINKNTLEVLEQEYHIMDKIFKTRRLTTDSEQVKQAKDKAKNAIYSNLIKRMYNLLNNNGCLQNGKLVMEMKKDNQIMNITKPENRAIVMNEISNRINRLNTDKGDKLWDYLFYFTKDFATTTAIKVDIVKRKVFFNYYGKYKSNILEADSKYYIEFSGVVSDFIKEKYGITLSAHLIANPEATDQAILSQVVYNSWKDNGRLTGEEYDRRENEIQNMLASQPTTMPDDYGEDIFVCGDC